MQMEKTIGGTVRKGAWAYEEDKLLKACINKYGEGKWHLVPARAGLNRCRKSCRLRWLNYLKPNIKRGSFAEDEVDMILRLHKLLGNRKKQLLPKETKKAHYHEIIKPQPRTFSTNSSWLKGKHKNFASDDVGVIECATSPLVASNENVNVLKECDTNYASDRWWWWWLDCTAQPCPLSEMWWEDLWNMEDQVDNEKIGPNSLIRDQCENSHLEVPKDLFSTQVPTGSDSYWDVNFCDVEYLLDL